MKRDFALVLASTFVLSWVNGMIYPVVPLYIEHLSGSDFVVGLSFALPFFVGIPMSFLWGMLSDRIGKRKPVLVYAGLAASLMFFAMPYLDVVPLIIARTVQQLFLSSGVLSYALVTEFYPKEKGKAIGDLNLFGGIGSMIGGFTVGYIVASAAVGAGSAQVVAFFLLCGALFFVSNLILLPVKEVEKERVGKPLGEMLRFGSGGGHSGSANGTIMRVCAAACFASVAILMVYSIFPMFVKEKVIGSAENAVFVLGIIAALASFGGMWGSGVAGRVCDRYGRKRIFIMAMALYTVAFLSYGLSTNIYVIAFIWAIPIYSFFYVSATATISDVTSEVERGRGIGLLNSVIGLGDGIGSLAGGFMALHIDYQAVFLISIAFVGAALVLAFAVRETLRNNGN